MSTADRHAGVERGRRRQAPSSSGEAPRRISRTSPSGRKPRRSARWRGGRSDRSATCSITADRRRRASCATRFSSSGGTGSGSTCSCSIRRGDSAEDPWIDGAAPSMSRIPASAYSLRGRTRRARRPASSARRRPGSRARSPPAGSTICTRPSSRPPTCVREVKRMTGVRYSFAVAGSEIYDDARDPRTLRHKMTEAEFVVVPSEVSRQQLLAVTGPGANGNIHRIYRGVDLGTFRYGADAFHDSSAVLAVCPLVEDSGVADLIDALADPARSPARRAFARRSSATASSKQDLRAQDCGARSRRLRHHAQAAASRTRGSSR